MELSPLDEWFVAEILPHEASLTRFLGRVWRNLADVPDLRQDIYIRIYESARNELPQMAKSYLFTVARNVVADRKRRNRIVSIEPVQDVDALHLLIDDLSPERRFGARQELQYLATVLDGLSDKCRAVVWLRRVEGLSQRETALRLGLNECAVESQLVRGMRTLARAIFEQARGEPQGKTRETTIGSGNG